MRVFLCNVFTVLTLIGVLVACTGQPTSAPSLPLPESSPTLAPSPEPVTITWAYWGDPWEVEINQRVIEVFEKDYPHIRVETYHRPWSNYFKDVRASFDAGEHVADVLFWAEAPIDIPKGYFMDLAPRMTAEDYQLDDFFPALLNHYQLGDRVYGLPRDSDTKVIFYNKRLFNRADIPYPDNNWTRADLRATALALKEAGVVEYSFAYEANDWWMIWVWQNGTDIFDNKLFPTRTLLGEPAAAEAIQFLADLTNVDQVTPPYEVLKSSAEIARLFKEQKLAMAFGNHALVPAFADIKEFEWDVVSLPRHKRAANLASGAGYFIATNTTRPDEAWTFLKFLAGPKGQAIFAESGIAVPARRSVAQSPIFMQQLPPHKAQVFLDAVELGEPSAAFVGADEIILMLNETVLPPVWQGQQDAAPALQAALPEIDRIIKASVPKE